MLRDITLYISQKLTSYVIGTNLFAGFVPSTITADHIAVIESGGVGRPELKDYVEQTLQVLTVAVDYVTARNMAQDIYDLLHGAAGVTLPVVVSGKEYYVNTIVAISLPQSVGQNEKGRFVISTNYVLRAQDK